MHASKLSFIFFLKLANDPAKKKKKKEVQSLYHLTLLVDPPNSAKLHTLNWKTDHEGWNLPNHRCYCMEKKLN